MPGPWSNYLSIDEEGIVETLVKKHDMNITATTTPSPMATKTEIENENKSGVNINREVLGRIKSLAVKITDFVVSAVLSLFTVISFYNSVVMAIIVSKTLLPIYSITARPIIKFPLDFFSSTIDKLWQNITTIVGSIIGLYKSKKRGIGVTFNATTNKAIEDVYLVIYTASGNLKTAFTDNYGKYEVELVPDTYSLRAEKMNYNFPSKIVNVEENNVFEYIYISTG